MDIPTPFLMLGCFLLGYFLNDVLQILIGSKPLTSEEYAELERQRSVASRNDIERRINDMNRED